MNKMEMLLKKSQAKEAIAPATPTEAPANEPASEPASESANESTNTAENTERTETAGQKATPKPLFASLAAKPKPAPVVNIQSATAQTRETQTATSLFAKPAAPAKTPFAFAAKKETPPVSPTVSKPAVVPEEIPTDRDELAAFEIGGAEEFSHPEQPDGFSEEQIDKIRGLFDMLGDNLNNKEAVANCVRSVISALQDNPNMRAILRPEDLGLMVRGLRTAYGVLAAKKQTAKAKRSVNEEEVNAFLAGFRDLGIKFGK